MTLDYGYVTVHETKDAAQGEVLAELLRQEGIAARFRGPATTLVGVAEHIVAMAVEVPAESRGGRPGVPARSRRRDRRRRRIVRGLGGEMADDGYTTIFRTTDTAQGGLVAEMLRGEGIDARFHTINTALIGLHGGLIEMELTVPVESEAQALELLADLEYVGAAEAIDQGQDVGPDDVDEVAAPAAASRWRALARAGFTLFLPGTCHLYAGRPWTALVLALAASWCISGAIAADRGSTRFDIAVATICMIVLCDMIQGVRVAAAEIRGVRASVARQVVAGVVLAVVAGLLGLAASTAVVAPRLWRAHVLKRFNVTCTRSGVVLASGDTSHRESGFPSHRASPSPSPPTQKGRPKGSTTCGWTPVRRCG